MAYILHFDGCCEPKNPGGYAIGSYILKDQKGLISQEAKLICKGAGATNNVAEWHGLLMGLRQVYQGELMIYGDSQLVLMQLMGVYQCKAEHLKPLVQEARGLVKNLQWACRWIPRAENKEADQLGKELYHRIRHK